MNKFRMAKMFSMVILLFPFFVVSYSNGETPAKPKPSESKYGGVLRVGITADIRSLDPHMSTDPFDVRTAAWHIFEHLYTIDEGFNLIPMLAESHTVSPDGKVYTIKIRKGITFHDGSDLTSEDVVASLLRWLQVGGRMANNLKNFIDDPDSEKWLKAIDKYTVQATFLRPNTVFMYSLSTIRRSPYIVPKEIAEGWGRKMATDKSTFIGTGPFKLDKWTPDKVFRLVRFDAYVPRAEAPIGYGGKRIAYVDAIEFIPLPDPSVRANKIEVGDIHFMSQGSVADIGRLRANPELKLVRGAPNWYDHVYFNLRNGVFSLSGGERSMLIRQAVLAAIDIEELAMTTYGDPAVYRIDPGYLWQETPYWSDIGKEHYNQANPEKAKQLLKQAGYAGETVILRTSAAFGEMKVWSEVLAYQLGNVGFDVDIEVMDMTTYSGKWFDSEGWDLAALYMSWRDDPILLASYPASDIFSRPKREEYPELHELYISLGKESDFAKRLAIHKQLQKKYYEEALHIRLADVFDVRFVRSSVMGLRSTPEMFFWNVWLQHD